MRLHYSLAAPLVGASLLLSPMVLAYETGDWLWHVNIMKVQPHTGGDGITAVSPGDQLEMGAEIMPSIKLDYMLRDGIAMGFEVPLQKLNQTVWFAGDKGSTKVVNTQTLPVSLTFSYYLPKWKQLRGYLIAGLQYYHIVSDERRAGTLPGLGNVEIDDSVGVGGGLGVEWDRDGHWSWNAAVVQYRTDQEATVYYDGGVKEEMTARPDPLVMTIGLSRRF